MTATTITAAGASDSLAISSGNDGTMVLNVGPTGSKVAAITISSAGVLKPLDAAWPAFSAYAGSAQGIPNNTLTILQINTEEFDTANAFNNTAGTVGSAPQYSFNPQVAGYYQINAELMFGTASIGVGIVLYKNGTLYKYGSLNAGSGFSSSANVSTLVYLNGSTDYLQVYGEHLSGTTTNTTAGLTTTYFNGALVRAA